MIVFAAGAGLFLAGTGSWLFRLVRLPSPPEVRARRILARLRARLPGSALVTSLARAVEEELPYLVNAAREIADHLGRSGATELAARRQSLESRPGAGDPAQVEWAERNRALLRQREAACAGFVRLRDRMESQIQNILLTLESIEDEVIGMTVSPDSSPERLAELASDFRSLRLEYEALERPPAGESTP